MFKRFSNTRIIGNRVIYLPKCHSTNDIAEDMIKDNKWNEGMIIITDFQTTGRGQRGRSWESEAGKNLTFSIILKPESLAVALNFYIGISVVLGICDGLVSEIPEIRIKWPNDLFVGDRKLGGILIENSIRAGRIAFSVAGIGINVNQEKFGIDHATSLKACLKTDLDREAVFNKIIHALDERYSQLSDSRLEQLKSDFENKMYGLEKEHRFKSGREFTGIIKGIDGTGRMIVDENGVAAAYGTGEIAYLD